MSTPSEELFRIEKELASLQAREAELLNQATRLTKQINNDYNAQLIKEQVEEQAKIDQYILNWIANHEDKFYKNSFMFNYDAKFTKTLIYAKEDSNEALISEQFNLIPLEQVKESLINIEHTLTLYHTFMSESISDNDEDFKEHLYISSNDCIQTEYYNQRGDKIDVTMSYDRSDVNLKISYDSSHFYDNTTTIVKLSDTTKLTIYSYGYNTHEVGLVDKSKCSLNNIPTAFKVALNKLLHVVDNYLENMTN